MPNVLLLETDYQLAKHTGDYLKLQGHQVVSFCDPQSAISSADSHCPDVIVLNLILAGRSGIEFLYELRSYPEWQQIPVIAIGKLSAGELEDYAPVFAQLNVKRHLYKPMAPLAELAATIESVLQPVAQ
jgi:DNA-binding response OmpR family regulator